MPFNCSAADPLAGCHVPVCDTNYDPPLCSALYRESRVPARARARAHAPSLRAASSNRCTRLAVRSRAADDQEQTPGYPHGDGDCASPGCDTGAVPTGEYMFNPNSANVSINGQTLVEWFIVSAKRGAAIPQRQVLFSHLCALNDRMTICLGEMVREMRMSAASSSTMSSTLAGRASTRRTSTRTSATRRRSCSRRATRTGSTCRSSTRLCSRAASSCGSRCGEFSARDAERACAVPRRRERCLARHFPRFPCLDSPRDLPSSRARAGTARPRA